MTLLLVVDDEPINHQLVSRSLLSLKLDIHYADNGKSGLSQARSLKPDLIITDVMMPDMDGYEMTRTLRRDPQFAATPILVLTSQSGLQDKVKSFEAGADDHLTKPFDASELVVRVTSLLRRVAAVRLSEQKATSRSESQMIAVHSLRGGTGSSTLAVNLGVSLAGLWGEPTILLDLSMTAGQVALMLNRALRRTWADVARYSVNDLDADVLSSVIGVHESNLHFIAAPTFPSDAETLRGDTLGKALQIIKSQYPYVVADLPHDFSDFAIQSLDAATVILIVAAPDMASIRAVAAAMDTYEKLGYSKGKIKFVLSAPFIRSSISKEKIESALGIQAITTIPYVQDVLVEAINLGQPMAYHAPRERISGVFEDLGFLLSKDADRKSKPKKPSSAWNRVYQRYQERKK